LFRAGLHQPASQTLGLTLPLTSRMIGLRSMFWFLGLLVLMAAAIVVAMYVKQDELIFYPQPLDAATTEALERSLPRSERFELVAEESLHLRGWLLRGSGQGPAPLLIYFGGNAEEVSWVLPELARIPGYAALVVNYRGYGRSDGRPSEKALYHDALAIYDRAVQRPDIDSHRVVVMGRSLGTGVATYLASQRPIAGVVLVSPYDSLISVAQSAYPFLPVRLLLKHRFESAARAPSIHVPLLAIAAAQDTLIPPERSRRLAQAWGGPAKFELLEARDHNNIHGHPLYWGMIVEFLHSIEAPRRA
jgi:pimeloyl-ACP methyl ester carboxylesterase